MDKNAVAQKLTEIIGRPVTAPTGESVTGHMGTYTPDFFTVTPLNPEACVALVDAVNAAAPGVARTASAWAPAGDRPTTSAINAVSLEPLSGEKWEDVLPILDDAKDALRKAAETPVNIMADAMRQVTIDDVRGLKVRGPKPGGPQ